MAHRNAQRLLAGLVLLEGSRATAKKLAGLALAEPEDGADLDDLRRTKDPIDLRLELLKRSFVADERLAREDRLVALRTPQPRVLMVRLVSL